MTRKSAFGAEPENLRELLSLGLEGAIEQDIDSKAPEKIFLDKTGSQIGPFRIEKEIGRGGAGVVYLAHDTKLDRRVAIKSLPADLANNENFQIRFQREAKLLASMNHPNIASIYEQLEEARGQKYIVLEYVPGDTLREKIAKGAMELKEALAIVIEITDAIAAAHAKGVIHRDIKPENIKITPDGRTKLLDFGIARMMGTDSITASTLTESGHIVGTVGYMSPEQARGKSTDHRSDIWAIGCILYEMLTGRCAFSGDTGTDILASILKTDPDWKEPPLDTDASVRRIIERCLKKNVDERYSEAEELLAELRECRQSLVALAPKVLNTKELFALLCRPKIAAVALLILLMSITGIGWSIHRSIKIKWAKDIAIPEITDLVRETRYSEAFLLAQKAKEYISDNLMLKRLISEVTCSYSINTNPPGAKISYKEYSDLDGDWIELSSSPANLNLPYGAYRWMITMPGYVPLEFARIGISRDDSIAMEIHLYEEANSPRDMVLIEMPDISHEYWIDKYEVTNEQFKKFVDAGGYQDPNYWINQFTYGGHEISFQDAMERFRDRSNRPGPATWEGGTFPEGQARYPVSGVSWHEAAAYAEFAGKSLPTVRHWSRATLDYIDTYIIPYSNFGDSGLLPVGTSGALCLSGVYDMAGNVREWCYNATDDSDSHRYILGGAWLQSSYMYGFNTQESPWNRDQINGFRCAKYESLDELVAPIEPFNRIDFTDVEAVSDEEFEHIKDFYIYEPANAEELNSDIAETDTESSLFWSKQKITFNAAYDNERVIAYLFLPKRVEPPYQPVIFFPGAGAIDWDSSNELVNFEFVDFIIKSGRAVLYPVYKGTYERRFSEGVPWEWTKGRNDFDLSNLSDLNSNRQWMVQMAMDLRRSVDYLTTKPDIDINKLTYYGESWGAALSPIMLAVEERIKFALICNGGFGGMGLMNVWPAADPIHFAPRVRCDILMINGQQDLIFPLNTSQKPMLKMLGKLYEGTDDQIDKDHMTYPGGHSNYQFLNSDVRENVLEWMDDHLGPVLEKDAIEYHAGNKN